MNLSPGNAQHIGAREEQQDSFGFSDLRDSAFVEHAGVVAVVADGMGGMAHGGAASKTAVGTFLSAYQAKSPSESIPQALDRALREANSGVVALAKGANLEDGMGTTLVAAVAHNGSLYWISAGDSRVYLLRRGELTQLTSDHIYANQLLQEVAEGKISSAEALTNAQRGDLTSYLGLPDLPAVDRNLQPFPIHPGESVILCSDGLYKAMSESEIAASFLGDTQDACEALVQRVLAKQLPRQDNLTIIALTCGSEVATNPGMHAKVPIAISVAFLIALLAFGALWSRKALHPSATSVANDGRRSAENSKPAQAPDGESGPNTVTSAPTTIAAKIVLDPLEWKFSKQNPKKNFAVRNNGAETLRIKVRLSGNDSGEFHQQNNCPSTLRPRKNCSVAVTFDPKAKGHHGAKLVVTENEEEHFAELTGIGPELEQRSIKKNSEQPSPPASHNTQQGSSSIQAQLGGTGPGRTIPPQTSAAQVQPAPTDASASSGTTTPPASSPSGEALTPAAQNPPPGSTAIDNSQAEPTLPHLGPSTQNTASGTISLVSSFRPYPPVIEFPKLALQKRSDPKGLNIMNEGNAPLRIERITIEGDKDDFFVEDDTCTGTVIGSSQKCTLQVYFLPQKRSKNQNERDGEDARSATLVIKQNGSDTTQKVKLSGSTKATKIFGILPKGD